MNKNTYTIIYPKEIENVYLFIINFVGKKIIINLEGKTIKNNYCMDTSR